MRELRISFGSTSLCLKNEPILNEPYLMNLDFHEEKWMSDCLSEFAPVFYRRYVDDCFLIFNEKEHAPLFLDYLNSKHQNINFTMETESNNQISFLDVLVRKDVFNFNTSVFGKPTFSGLVVSYFSYCCMKLKLN